MGLFSSKYIVNVASVPYNMAGDLTDRVNYLKSTVSYYVLSGSRDRTFSQALRESYSNGPAIDQKAFFRWARTNFEYGMPTASLVTKDRVPFNLVQPLISVPAGMKAEIVSAFIDSPNTFYWAQKHVLDNRPELFETNWTQNYEVFTNTLTIGYENGTFDVVPLVLSPNEPNYLIAYYFVVPEGFEAVPEDTYQKVFIYKIGSGQPALDVLRISYPIGDEFFPVVPLRINNVPITQWESGANLEKISKAYKKGTGQRLSRVMESINTNQNVADIDYAFMVFGVELNTQEQEGRRYIYEFLQLLSEEQTNAVQVDLWLKDLNRAPPGSNSLVIAAPGVGTYRVEMTWLTIRERRANGLGKAGAKTGELWFEQLPSVTASLTEERERNGKTVYRTLNWTVPRCQLFYQDRANSYRVLDIYGLTHNNYVYSDRGARIIKIDSAEALNDPDESGFIIPLHYPTLQSLPSLVANQLALSNRILVFNTFTVTKVRWYQRGIFKILFAVVVGVISGFLFPGAVGLLGANVAVGASLGFSGLTAAIIGGAVNALAALVLTTFIEAGAKAVFGEKLGGLVGTLVSFFTMSYIMNFQLTGSFGMNWGDLFKAENLMKLIDAVTGGAAAWARGEFSDIERQMREDQESFEETQDAIEKRAQELLGYGGGFIDPLMFTRVADISAGGISYAESSETFLSRTLMTGSDIVELSLSMIEEFPTLSLELPKSIA